jgi:hypothetical protein
MKLKPSRSRDLTTFARKKGSRDRKKRKRRSLRDNLFGTTTTGRVARGAGALLATGAALKYGVMPKVIKAKTKISNVSNAVKNEVNENINRAVNTTRQSAKSAQEAVESVAKTVDDINQTVQRVSNAVNKVNRGVNNTIDNIKATPGRILALPGNIARRVRSKLTPKPKPQQMLPPPSTNTGVYNGYDTLEDYVKNRKRRRFNSGNPIVKFARKKGSKDKKKRKRSLRDKIVGTTTAGRVVRVAGLGAGLAALRYGGAALGEIGQARGFLKKAGKSAPLTRSGQRAYMKNTVMSDAPAAARERFAMDVAKLTRNKDKYASTKLARQLRRSRMDIEANSIPMQTRKM